MPAEAWMVAGGRSSTRPPGGTVGGARSHRHASLVGRAGELSALQAELSRATAGELRVVLVSGDAGVGKSRLVQELADSVSGAVVLHARGFPLGAGDAYGLWVEALERLLGDLDEPAARAVCGEFMHDLATILHRAAVLAGPRPVEAPRPRLAEGLVHVIDNLSLRALVVIVLDDIFLADPSSWETLRRLARQLPARPVLVLATARSTELSGSEVATHVLFELGQDGFLQRLSLGPLTRDGIAALCADLLGRRPPEALVHWLFDRSEGNPLYARGLLRALLDEGADIAAPQLRRLPEDLVERIRSRMGRYSEPLQRVLELAAVLGRPATLPELEALTANPPEVLAVQVDELVATGALVELESGRRLSYALSHGLIRDAVYTDIGTARRRVLHRQAARTLAGQERLAEAAAHFARSAEVGDPEALDALLRAIAEAETREAYREALTLVAELVELLPGGDERWRLVYDAVAWDADWVVDHRADVHGALGVRAMRAIDDLFAAAGESAARRAAVKFRLATFLAWGTGELDEAAAVAAAATRLFAAAADRRAELISAREEAFIAGLRGDFPAMEARGRLVRTAACQEGDRFVEMQACQAVGYAAVFQGRVAEATHAAERLIQIATEDGKVYRLTGGLGVLAAIKAWDGAPDEACGLLDRARKLDPQYRDGVLLEQYLFSHSWSGNVQAGLAAAREIVAWAPAAVSLRRSFGMAVAAIAAVEAGQAADAQAFLTRAQAALAGRDFAAYAPVAEAAAGMLEWHTAGAAAALPRLVSATDRLMAMSARVCALAVAVDAAEAAAEVGDGEHVARMRDHVAEIAATMGAPGPSGLLAYADAQVALLAGDRIAAERHARAAVDLVERTGWRGHLARCLHLLGRLAPRAEAVEVLNRAAGLHEAHGAEWRRTRVLADLNRLGGAGRRAADAAAGPAALSPREREVARLAVAGLSTRQIADQLVVSERTIETHLSRAYAKAGVASRLELARRAPELGL